MTQGKAKTTRGRVRILIAKPGLDGHDRGAKIIARAMRDAGFEVIYTGLRRSPEEIVEAAIQEDVDIIGLSCLSGAHLTLCPRVAELLEDRGAGEILVVAGGIIPQTDVPFLKQAGIAEVFGPGTDTGEVIEWIRRLRPGSTDSKRG